MPSQSLYSLHRVVWIAAMSALIAVGAYMHFPLGPVPISLQPLLVLISGYILGPWTGFMSVGLYLVAGLVGLPVFSGGNAGLGHLLGPTGGYLFGFIFAPIITGGYGLVFPEKGLSWPVGIVLGILAFCPVYLLGVSWLKLSLEISWFKAVATGMFPFLISDILQVLASAGVGRYVQKYSLGLVQVYAKRA